MKLHSISDAITNSSSEIFSFPSRHFLKESQNFCNELHRALNLPGEWTDHFSVKFSIADVEHFSVLLFNNFLDEEIPERFYDLWDCKLIRKIENQFKNIEINDYISFSKCFIEYYNENCNSYEFFKDVLNMLSIIDDIDYGCLKSMVVPEIIIKDTKFNILSVKNLITSCECDIM
jgi:hypothetical protein